ARSSSSCAVRGSAPRNDATLLASIIPAATTVRIWAVSQVAAEGAAEAAPATRAAKRRLVRGRRPTGGSHRRGGRPTLACGGVEFEITPKPSEEERAALEAALAEEAEETPSPWLRRVLPGREEPQEP